MPLLSYFSSLTATVNGDFYVIVGTQENEPDRTIFYYYLLNRVAAPLVRSDSADVSRLSGLYDEVKSKIDMRRGDWNTLFTECFAEAMDIRLEETLYHLDSSGVQASLSTEYKFGFILCPTIYQSLEKYESSGMSFSEYFPGIMERINLQDEKNRWEEFWKGR